MDKKNQKEEAQALKVRTNTFVGSGYSQVVSVTVTDTDVTLEFVFVNPRSKEGEVVSRVTLPRIAGEGLAKTIAETVAKHESEKIKK